MNDDHNIQFLAARSRKRSHREMSDLPYRNQSPWDHQGEAFRSTNTALFPPHFIQPGRYSGDGFDYRRPVMSATSHVDEVIDLTNEPDSPPAQRSRPGFRSTHSSRPPRFGRDIMTNVVDLEEPPGLVGEQNPASPPEVQFIRATVRPDQSSARDRRFVDESNLLDILRMQHRFSFSGEEAIRQGVALHTRHLMTPHLESMWLEGPEGIDLTNLDLSSLNPPRPAPSYEPPSPAPEGFTRSAQDDEAVVCPNCEHELGTGDDVKQQIWVAKPCGHVYCGECAKNRSLSKAKKISQRASNPFSKCLVDNCGKLVSAPKSMFQIYL